MNTQIITEITPLSEKDCFYLVDRYKCSFTYPIHRHVDFELNFVINAAGARRVVGDSVETIGDFDLVLIGKDVEHGWLQHECVSDKIREITIQFKSDIFGDNLLAKNQLAQLRKMLQESSGGIAFDAESIAKVANRLYALVKEESGFSGVLELMGILHQLADEGHYRRLSSSAFVSVKPSCDSRRVQKVQDYINEHYKEDIRLGVLADLAGMTPTAFSRFFKLRTGRSVSDYVIDVRLGHASQMLVGSTASVAEICYACGFNNVSNFNRIFKKKKIHTPKIFREIYQHHKKLV